MKKTLWTLAVVFTAIINLHAQKLDVGTNFLSFGVGPSMSYTNYNTVGTPAVKIAFDHGLKEIGPGVLSLGGDIGFFASHYKGSYGYWENLTYHSGTYKANWLYFIVAFRVGYYYNFKELGIPDLNAYAGIGSGLRYHIYNDDYTGNNNITPNDVSGADFHMAVYGGANYFVTKKIAFFTEFGYDVCPFTAGVTFQL